MNNEVRNRIFNLREGCSLYNISEGSIVYNDWFLPSIDELNEMYVNLHLEGVGEFMNDFYWSSTEGGIQHAFNDNFDDGSQDDYFKDMLCYVRACRAFTSVVVYALKDAGPASGLIFYKSGNDYLEAAPLDQSISQAWSNIVNIELGTTGTVIGTGMSNTIAIINQLGHINSAAKVCNDYSVVV
jgi:hypothetical protein